jgi:hypothetical protein
MLDSEQATKVLAYLEKYQYATLGHVTIALPKVLPTSRVFRRLVVASGVRAATAFDTCDDEPPVVLPEVHGEPELPDADLLVWTVLERLAVVRRVASRRGDDFVELVEYPVLVGGEESVEVVFGRRGYSSVYN